MEHVIIGVDPHKLSATIEVVDQHEKFLGSGRFATDRAGYKAMRSYAKTWPERVWAVEGANGVGRPLARRLLEAGERSSMSRRSLPLGSGCSTPGTTARATHATRTPSRSSRCAPTLCGCCRSLGSSKPCGCSPTAAKRSPGAECRPSTGSKLCWQNCCLAATRDITTGQAKAMLATVRPRDIAGKTRRRIAADELTELVAVEAKIKKATAELKAIVLARGSRLMHITEADPSWPPESWPALVMSPASLTGTGSPPGRAPHPSTHRRVNRTATASPVPGTGG